MKPTALKLQAERADQMIRAAGQSAATPVAEPAPPNPSQGDDGAEIETVDVSLHPTQPRTVQLAPEDTDEDADNRDPGDESDHDQDPAPAPAQKPAVDWEQKFRVMDGKYRAEVPQLQTQLADSRAGQEALRATIATLTSRLDQLEAAKAAPPEEPEATITPLSQREMDEFGPELLDAAARHARSAFEPELRKLRNMVKDLTSKLEDVGATTKDVASKVTKSSAQLLHDRLDAKLSDWRAINADAGFKAWVGEVDPFAGRTRQSMLMEAYNRGDADRVLRFFTAYQSESAAITPAAERSAPSEGGTRSVDPAKLVAPGRGRSAPRPSAPTPPRVWTAREIADVYLSNARGRFKDNPAEFEALEREIAKAQREGRVRAA